MGRRKLTQTKKAVTYRIDTQLNAELDILLRDPLADRSIYGQKSAIVEELLRRLIAAARSNAAQMEVRDLVKALRG